MILQVHAAGLFFCEKPDFKIEELLNVFGEFSRQFVAAIDQNNARKLAAKKAEDRKKAMESMQERQKAAPEGAVIDSLVARVQKGDFSRGMSSAAPAFARGASSTSNQGPQFPRSASNYARMAMSPTAKAEIFADMMRSAAREATHHEDSVSTYVESS